MEKVSVIVPVYNVEAYIGKCVDSLLNQTYPEIEYIFIDDCGTDNSVFVAKQLIGRHPRQSQVSWIVQECNKGQSVARNAGVAQATGTYIFFVDSDDYITPDSIETHVRYAEEYKADMVVGGQPQDRLFEGAEVYDAFLAEAWGKTPWERLIRRELLLENRIEFQAGMIFEDAPWNLRIAWAAGRVYTFQAHTYTYVIRENSSCHKATPYRFESYVKMLDDYLNIYMENGLCRHRPSMEYFELSKFRGMEYFITDRSDWKMYRPLLKRRLIPVWQLLLGRYGAKLQKRAFLSVLPYCLYKPLNRYYQRFVGR